MIVFVHNFGKFWPTFQIVSSLDSAKKFATKPLSCFPQHINYVAILPYVAKRKMSLLSFYDYKCYSKKVSKANKSQSLLRYSLTYHYDLISLSSSEQTKRKAVYVTNSTQLPHLDFRGTCISMDSAPDG